MANLFIFTAGNKEAQKHLDKSVKNPIDPSLVYPSFQENKQDELNKIYNTADGFYAWGATPGTQNQSRWNSIQRGDHVLCVFNNKYKYYAKILGKYHNKELAKKVWGTDQNDNTWEYMYFLTKPKAIDIPVKQYENYLNKGYMGFTKISNEKIKKIAEDYGSLENFINTEILNESNDISTKPNFWWVNQKDTYKEEHDGGFIWAPQENNKGQKFHHWTNVSKVRKGDIIFHYVSGNIQAVSLAKSEGYQAPKPQSFSERHWEDNGWRVDLQYYVLSQPIPITQIGLELNALKLQKGPINNYQGVNQGYLFELNHDAAQIIANEIDPNDLPDEIKEIFSEDNTILTNKADITELLERFTFYLNKKGFYFKDVEIEAFIDSILTKPFVILTGNSGSGKTKLAKLFANWLNLEYENAPSRYSIVPVGADWTDNRNVIGFVNHLKTEEGNNNGRPLFQGTPILDLILKARKDPLRPYFLVLDEMNLSHVERYFSDFLSAMESQEYIPVHEENTKLQTSSGFEVPPYVPYPQNLYVIGTVNIDETTYMFSPKVLDRANVLEFRLQEKDLNNYFQQPQKGTSTADEDEKLPYGMPQSFQDLSLQAREIGAETLQDPPVVEKIQETLMNFFSVLKKSGFEFAYRTVDEVLRYSRVSYAILPEDQEWDWYKVMDMQILQKILPKLHGSRRRLETTLTALIKLCELNDQHKALQLFERNSAQLDDFEENPSSEEQFYFPASRLKLVQMVKALKRDQFVSFIQ